MKPTRFSDAFRTIRLLSKWNQQVEDEGICWEIVGPICHLQQPQYDGKEKEAPTTS